MTQTCIKTVTAKNGNEVVFRYPTIEDAPKLLAYINTLSDERTFIRFQGEQLTLEEETTFLQGQLTHIENNTGVFIVAITDETIIGAAQINAQTFTERHVGAFGIALAKEYRGMGIGRILMNTVIEEAKQHIPELEIITLIVHAKNGIACSLYESFGFEKYGSLPNGVKLEQGYMDQVLMYKRI